MRSTARLPKPIANPAAGARPLVAVMAVCGMEFGEGGVCGGSGRVAEVAAEDASRLPLM